MKQDSSVGIAMGWIAGPQFSAWARYFFLLHNFQSGPGACPALGGGALSPVLKWLGCEADRSPSSNAEFKNGGAVSPLLHVSWCGA
jgi:hypothetical protein